MFPYKTKPTFEMVYTPPSITNSTLFDLTETCSVLDRMETKEPLTKPPKVNKLLAKMFSSLNRSNSQFSKINIEHANNFNALEHTLNSTSNLDEALNNKNTLCTNAISGIRGFCKELNKDLNNIGNMFSAFSELKKGIKNIMLDDEELAINITIIESWLTYYKEKEGNISNDKKREMQNNLLEISIKLEHYKDIAFFNKDDLLFSITHNALLKKNYQPLFNAHYLRHNNVEYLGCIDIPFFKLSSLKRAYLDKNNYLKSLIQER